MNEVMWIQTLIFSISVDCLPTIFMTTVHLLFTLLFTHHVMFINHGNRWQDLNDKLMLIFIAGFAICVFFAMINLISKLLSQNKKQME